MESEFDSWEGFMNWGRAKYDYFVDDKDWLKYVYEYVNVNHLKLANHFCLGTPGIWCVHEDDNYDCFDCLYEDINEVKRWFGIQQ
jgi:hypothetical protein